MRIVLSCGIFPPDIGGPATYSQKIADSLQARNHKVSVVCFSKTSGRDKNFPYPVHRIGRDQGKIRRYWRYLVLLFRLARTADAVYAQGTVAGGIQAFLASKLLAKKYAVKVTGDYAWEQAQIRFQESAGIVDFQKRNQLPGAIARMRFVQRLVCRHASAVITPSQFLKNIVRTWNVPEPKITVIHNAIDPSPVDQESRELIQKRIGLPGRTVVSIGRLVPWKGFDTLIQIWPDVCAELADTHLYIGGDGPEMNKLQSLAHESLVADRIHLLGGLPPEGVKQYLRAADLFVLNSSYEGLSHLILEALKFGTVPAVSDVGGNPEVVSSGANGFLFPYNDRAAIVRTISTALRHENLARQLSPAMQETVERFSYRRMRDDTLKLLEAMS